MSTVFAQAPRPDRIPPGPAPPAPPRRSLAQRVLGRSPSAWLYVLPAVIIVIGLAVVPVGWSAIISLQDKDPIAETTSYVGLENYRDLFDEPEFRGAVEHTLVYAAQTKLELYMTIGRGRGYRPAEENKSSDQPIGVIPMDSIFSPVRRVAYAVEQARVGQKPDFDKLTLDIEMDRSIDPQAALREAAELLISQLAIFTDETASRSSAGRRRPARRARYRRRRRRRSGAAGRGVQHPDRGARARRALVQLPQARRHTTVGDLISKSEAELNAIPNFGKKSIDEVIETLHTRGLDLRGTEKTSTAK